MLVVVIEIILMTMMMFLIPENVVGNVMMVNQMYLVDYLSVLVVWVWVKLWQWVCLMVMLVWASLSVMLHVWMMI